MHVPAKTECLLNSFLMKINVKNQRDGLFYNGGDPNEEKNQNNSIIDSYGGACCRILLLPFAQKCDGRKG